MVSSQTKAKAHRKPTLPASLEVEEMERPEGEWEEEGEHLLLKVPVPPGKESRSLWSCEWQMCFYPT
jgi:hypothetical protein